MAYNVLYYNEIPNSLVYGNLTRIEILERDYSGAPINLNKRIGATISFGNNGDGREDPIKKKTATISLFSQKSLEFEHLFTSDDRKYQVKVYYDTDLVFIGFLESDSYEEPYSFYNNYEVVLTARDNLGRLEDVDYLDGNGDRFTGLDTIANVLDYATSQTGYVINRNDFIDIYASGQLETQLMTQQTYVNRSGFWDQSSNEPISCYEVLERILKGLGVQLRQITLRGWEYREQAKFFEMPFVNIDDIKPRFLQDSINMDVTPNDAYWMGQSANLALKPAWKSFTLNQDLKTTESFYIDFPRTNNDFTQGSSFPYKNGYYYGTINGWNMNGNNIIYEPLNPTYFALPEDDNTYISTTINNIQQTDIDLRFVFNLSLLNRIGTTEFKPVINYDILISNGSDTRILTSSGWVVESGQTKELTFNEALFVGDSPQDLTIISGGIPISGDLTIRFWGCDIFIITPPVAWLRVNNVSLTFNSKKVTRSLNANIDQNNNVIDDFSIEIGEVLDEENSRITYLGGLFDSNGDALTDWHRKGETNNRNLLQVVAEGYDLLNNRVSRQITGSIHGWKWDFNTNIKDQGRTLMINSGTWDLANDALLDTEFIEVFEYKNEVGAFDDGFDDGFENSDSAEYKTNTIFTLTEKFE